MENFLEPISLSIDFNEFFDAETRANVHREFVIDAIHEQGLWAVTCGHCGKMAAFPSQDESIVGLIDHQKMCLREKIKEERL